MMAHDMGLVPEHVGKPQKSHWQIMIVRLLTCP